MERTKPNYDIFKWCLPPLKCQKWKFAFLLLFAFSLCQNVSAQDCCDDGDKVNGVTFTYTGGSCPGNNSQGDKSDCTGGAVNSATVFIEANEKEDGSGDQYFSGNVSLGETFSFSETSFPSKIFIQVGNQINEIHMSCSAPVVIGDQFGAIRLEFATFKNGVQCGPPPPPECNNVTDGGTISSDESNCGPYNPANITSVEDPSGNSNPNGGGGNGEDCCEDGDKAKGFTFTYVGGSCPGNNSQGDKSDCSGGAVNSGTVFIEATEKENGSGDQYFSGNVSLGESFSFNATDDKFPSKIFVRVGNQVNEIHASCSAPIVTGETFGALQLDNVVFKNGFVCGPPPTPPVEYQWISSTNGCPNNINQAIAGATSESYNPPTISQTTSYIRLARRDFCDNSQVGATEGWIASNCVVKTVEVCDPCLGQGGDSDGDGVCDNQDNCDFTFNPNQQDSDGDGIGDACDNPCQNQGGDSDGDGVCDNQDNCDFTFNPNQQDSDGDGIGDACDDPCQNQGGDSDGDGVCDNQDNCDFTSNPGQQDSDGDGIGDVCDNGDLCDNIDITITTDGKIRVTGQAAAAVSQIQVFNTGWTQVFNCSGNCNDPEMIMAGSGTFYVYVKLYTAGWSPICQTNQTVTVTTTNPCQNQGGDSDGDGVCDNQDNCDFTANPGQEDSDGDGIGDACDTVDPCQGQGGDSDGDGVCNNQDNCDFAYNPNQQDSDGDGIGDACDTTDPCQNQGGDSDGDGVCNNQDNCDFAYNPNQQDSDGDGIGDACDTTDPCASISAIGNAGSITVNGLTGAIVQVQIFNSVWATVFNCSGNCNKPAQTINNLPSGQYYVKVKFYSSTWSPICETNINVTVTGGNPCASQGGDSDGDGVCNNQDNCDFTYNPNQQDSDGDGIGDACDTVDPCQGKGGDSDGDGICDDDDNCPTIPNPFQEDIDNDGVGDDCDEPATGNACDNVIFDVTHNSITVSGLHTSPISMLLIFNEHWSQVFSCAGDCDPTETINNLNAGVYYVKATLLASNWQKICVKDAYLICGNQTFMVAEPNPELYFDARRVNREVALSWTTNSDFMTDYFVVEHSADNVNFETLKENESISNAIEFVHYKDEDVEPTLGVNYYRLKQYYIDGSFTYSQVREVEFNLDLESIILYPNPATNLLNLNAKKLIDQDFDIKIVNALGQSMLNRSYKQNSEQNLSFELDQFTPGLYNLTIQMKDGQPISRSFIVVDF